MGRLQPDLAGRRDQYERSGEPDRSLTRRPTDAGTGVIGTVAGVTVFLAFLLFAVQLLVNLHTTTAVTDAAHEGAGLVARYGSGEGGSTELRARADAEAQVRQLLGSVGDRAELDWDDSNSDEVVLHIRVRPPRFLLPSAQGALGFDEVDRRIHVRREGVR